MPQERLKALHDAVTERLIKEVTEGSEKVTDEGVRYVAVDPRMVAEAVKFLKDNGINRNFGDSEAEQKEAVQTTLRSLPQFENEETG